jgi:uncharacterized membrane protein YbaN (DUF454 family)
MTLGRKVAGFSLLALGTVGCLLPVMPGIPFLLGGAALLGSDDPRIRRLIQLMTKKKLPTAQQPPKVPRHTDLD